MFLAWAGMVDTIIFSSQEVKLLDRWIKELESRMDEYVQLPSEEIKPRVTNSMFIALVLRQPQHPDVESWAEETLLVSKKQVDENIKALSLFNLAHHRMMTGDSTANQKLLKFFSEDRTGKLLLDMTQCSFVRAGERIVTQGEITDKAYIIQHGSRSVIVEKNGESHPVDHRRRGDIIGATPILTGEPQMAHVEAKTDVELCVLKSSMLNNISTEHPELLDFLTEIVASRFDTTRPIAERKISKYIASDIIGRGAFSIVYGGIHAGLKMPVAIKMMKHDMAMNPVSSKKLRKRGQNHRQTEPRKYC